MQKIDKEQVAIINVNVDLHVLVVWQNVMETLCIHL